MRTVFNVHVFLQTVKNPGNFLNLQCKVS